MSAALHQDDDAHLKAMGVQAELRRHFSPLSMLGLAFAILNSWTALATSLSLAITSGGSTAVLWGLVTAGVCNLCLAASLAEFLSAYPTAGGQYHWVAMLSWKKQVPLLSWITGWINTAGWIALTASAGSLGSTLIVGLVSLFNPNYVPLPWHQFLIYIAYNVLAFVINAFGNHLLPHCNRAALIWSLSGFAIISITLLATASPSRGGEGYNSASFVFTEFINTTGWPNGIAWLLGLLQGGFGLVGFDGTAHMVEEISNASIEGPKIMIYCVGIGLGTGFIFLMILLFVAGDINTVTSSAAGPLIQIIFNATKSNAGTAILLLFPLGCLLFAALSIMTTSSRMTYAFARDGALPYSRVFARVHPKLGIPLNSLILTLVCVVIFGCVFLGSSSAFFAIISASVVALNVSYGIPILIHCLRGRRILGPRKFALPEPLAWVANLIGISYVLVTTVLFLFPPALPVTGQNMNYAVVAFAVVLIISVVQWFVDGRKNYTGPQIEMVPDDDIIGVAGTQNVSEESMNGKGHELDAEEKKAHLAFTTPSAQPKSHKLAPPGLWRSKLFGAGGSNNKLSLFRYLFPHVRQRARERLSDFRFDKLPHYKVQAQSSIYRFIVRRQQKKKAGKTIIARIRRQGARLTSDATGGDMSSSGAGGVSASESLATGEVGSRRRRIAGYLKAANDLRQSYRNAYATGGNADLDEDDAGIPGAFPEMKVARSEEEEMVLFPSYAKRHEKSQTSKAAPTPQSTDESGPGDAEYWKREWQFWEDENAIVDVDVRGWIYSPHKGPMTRKNRLLFGIARQLSGVPAPSSESLPQSRSSSTHRERVDRREEESVEIEAERIVAKGQHEAEIAGEGGYSEEPGHQDSSSLYTNDHTTEEDGNTISALTSRKSWNQPSNMSPEELAIANRHLISRLKPFLTLPSVGMSITVFYYNDTTSQSRTTTTDEAGHFNFRAALSFVPTHVRVLASADLSATEEIIITEPKGVSLVSDIDDTIKHSAVGSGAKEIFRNTFIRNLADLTIEGVKEWYTKMSDKGVKLHYVSNSPWQLYPVLVSYFASAGLPPGSFHLKHYSGMLQGIFEPVAERKKGTLDRLMHDFPQRRFILVGDSGEADLELYTDIALANPGKILGIFIRDVTSSTHQNFFDTSLGPLSGMNCTNGAHGHERYDLRKPRAELKPTLPPRPRSEVEAPKKEPEEDLMSFSDDEEKPPPRRVLTDPSGTTTALGGTKTLPVRPAKPEALRSMSREAIPASKAEITRKAPPPPPKPRHFSVPGQHGNNNLPSVTQTQNSSRDSSTERTERYSYRTAAKNKIASAYNALPSAGSSWTSSQPSSTLTSPHSHQSSSAAGSGSFNLTSPPLPPRRNITSYPAAAASYAASKIWSTPGDDSDSGEAPLSKREEMWRRRWARAKDILDRKGIMLRAWRVGSDVMDDALKLVEETEKKHGWHEDMEKQKKHKA